MSNNIEQEFFEAFGIEPKRYCEECGIYDFCWFDELEKDMPKCEPTYPPITPEIVLKLEKIIFYQGYALCIDCEIFCYFDHTFANKTSFSGDRVEALLKTCISLKNERRIQDQVRGIFNECI